MDLQPGSRFTSIEMADHAIAVVTNRNSVEFAISAAKTYLNIQNREAIMFRSIFTAAILLLAPAMVVAQSAERSVTFEVDATVRSVDAETRRIVLDNSTTGESEIIIAGPEVVNFDQISAGDKVKAVYTLGIASRMAEPGETDSVALLDARAAEGSTPGAMAGTAVKLVLEFVMFDAEKSIATVIDSTGSEQMIEVASDEGREFASSLSKGDMVALTFTEGLAVGIVEK